jgi:hypothetical protein
MEFANKPNLTIPKKKEDNNLIQQVSDKELHSCDNNNEIRNE